jgi:hypothetical protein
MTRNTSRPAQLLNVAHPLGCIHRNVTRFLSRRGSVLGHAGRFATMSTASSSASRTWFIRRGCLRLFALTKLVARNGDQLQGQATGQPAFPILPSAKDEFFANIGGIAISFTRDDKGAVSGLVLDQQGDHPAPKLSPTELPPEPKELS